ncbi:aldo-keto reductase [Aspergillus insuetus]
MSPTRQLGANGPQVAAQGPGLMGLSMFYNTRLPDLPRLKFLCRWFKKTGKRKSIFLATKFGIQQHPGQPSSIHNEPEYVRRACLQSRARLGLAADDPIDFYYCHQIDLYQPIEVTVQAMPTLVRDGLVRYLGFSEFSADTLLRADRVHPIVAVQIELSPFAVESLQNEFLAACQELGVSVIACSPLSRGFLTGKLNSPEDFAESDRRRVLWRFSPENILKNLDIVRMLEPIASRKGCLATQLTLGWLSALDERIIPIPGTIKLENLEENLGSLDVQVTDEDIQTFNSVIETAAVQGHRHPKVMMPSLYLVRWRT